ncbi:glycosyltransferase family 2 protein [Lentisalinibacter orientalis]|uniref:glycosyltransferase family 2 protein n=1 Tax=Lentisalinibacter orientalis TaxID=2992241 RepID=UPI0038672597
MTTAGVKVTVGIPVFNGERWLAETIESVLRQTLQEIEVIVSDNASTDDSWRIAQDIAAGDERVQCYRNAENLGVFRNLDRTFELSSTPYFKWCAVGDVVEKSFLEKALEILEQRNEVMLVYSATGFIGRYAHQPSVHDLDASLESFDAVERYRAYFSSRGLNSPFHGLIRSRALARTSLNRAFRGSDLCLIAALLLQGPFVRLPDKLLYRRIEPETATAVKTRAQLDAFFGSDAEKVNRRPIWQFEKQLLRDVIRCPTEMNTRLRLMPYLLRRFIWQRRELLGRKGRRQDSSTG